MVELSSLVNIQTISIVSAALSVVFGVYKGLTELRKVVETRHVEMLLEFIRLDNENMQNWIDVMFHQNPREYEEWPKKYGPLTNPEACARFYSVLNFYQSIGLLARERLIKTELLYQIHGASTYVRTWETIEPLIKRWREEWNEPTMYDAVEYLYEDVKKKYPSISIPY